MKEVCVECESTVTVCVCVCFRPDSWCASAWPGTSLGSSASVMTEDPWLGVTSCGSPGSEMCQQRRRRTGASPPVGCFSCVQAADRVGGRMPPPENQGCRLQQRYLHLIVSVWRSPTGVPCPVSLAPGGLSGTAWSSIVFPHLCTCVCAFTGPKAHPSFTPLWPSPSAWFPHTLSKPFNGF